MNPLRKVIGLLVIIFFAMPILFGIIWAVGLTRAAVSPQLVSDLPQEIIAEIPQFMDEVFEEAQDDDVIADENTRNWFQAAAKTGTTPRDLMREIGLMDWLENELADSMEKIGETLRGERRTRTLFIDMRPLKKALAHPAIDRWFLNVLENLPPCDENSMDEWRELELDDIDWTDLPACRPDLTYAETYIDLGRNEALEDIPDEIEVFEDVRMPPFGISRFVSLVSYGLFLIPAGFLLLGALIAGTSLAGFYRWFGIPTMICGLISLAFALMTRGVLSLITNFAPYHVDSGISDLEGLVLEKSVWFQQMLVDFLFSPVVKIAGFVTIIGLLLVVLSFIVRKK